MELSRKSWMNLVFFSDQIKWLVMQVRKQSQSPEIP